MKIAKAKKLKHEVPWHEPLLHIYQAAAAGQDGVSFAEEDMNPSDGAREDIRGLINNIPLAPQEAKAKYYLATSSSDGIETNKRGLSKVCGMWIASYLSSLLMCFLCWTFRFSNAFAANMVT
jgi:hypothetical protein